jgi:hypothetical protein
MNAVRRHVKLRESRKPPRRIRASARDP